MSDSMEMKVIGGTRRESGVAVSRPYRGASY